jgi:hypothetical protein
MCKRAISECDPSEQIPKKEDMNPFPALLAILAAAAVTGCSSKADANEKNFGTGKGLD